MKNILFATTALVATAGIAAADVSFSGSANVGILEVDGAAQSALVSNVAVKATMAGETDNGLSFGTALTFRSGDDLDLDAGDLTNTAGGFDNETSAASIFVSGAFGKLTLDRDGVDNIHNDDIESHDVQYDGTFGDLAVTVTADIDDATSTGADGEDWAAKVVYTMDALTLTAATDDSSESDVTVAYKMNDMIGLSVNFDTNGQSATESETIAKVTYANDGVTAHLALADDDDDQWEIGFGYTAGAMTFNAVVAENDGAGDTEMDLSASYDLGGGMSIKAATNETGAYYVGTALAF